MTTLLLTTLAAFPTISIVFWVLRLVLRHPLGVAIIRRSQANGYNRYRVCIANLDASDLVGDIEISLRCRHLQAAFTRGPALVAEPLEMGTSMPPCPPGTFSVRTARIPAGAEWSIFCETNGREGDLILVLRHNKDVLTSTPTYHLKLGRSGAFYCGLLAFAVTYLVFAAGLLDALRIGDPAPLQYIDGIVVLSGLAILATAGLLSFPPVLAPAISSSDRQAERELDAPSSTSAAMALASASVSLPAGPASGTSSSVDDGSLRRVPREPTMSAYVLIR